MTPHRFVLIWQTPTMPAPAFWYYPTYGSARRDAALMGVGVSWLVKPADMRVRIARGL